VSSYVAAGLAGADMWRTGWLGLRLSAIAFLLPFLWAYDPALLLQGSWLAIVVVCCTTLCSAMLIARGVAVIRGTGAGSIVAGVALGAAVVAIATSPIWLGHESWLALLLAALGVAIYVAMPALLSLRPKKYTQG
jgi:TRAP-type uncharacterized transport system fused permease subunit